MNTNNNRSARLNKTKSKAIANSATRSAASNQKRNRKSQTNSNLTARNLAIKESHHKDDRRPEPRRDKERREEHDRSRSRAKHREVFAPGRTQMDPRSREVREGRNGGVSRHENGAMIRSNYANTIVIQHKERFGTLVPTIASQITARVINPGNSDMFPWLSGLAPNYETYRFRKLRFIFETDAPTTVFGSLTMAVEFDADDPVLTYSSEQLDAMICSNTCTIYEDMAIQCRHSNLNKQKTYFVSEEIAALALDDNEPRTTNVGNFYTRDNVLSTNRLTYGRFYVDYEIEMTTPQPRPKVNTFAGLTTNTIPTFRRSTGTGTNAFQTPLALYDSNELINLSIKTLQQGDQDPGYSVFSVDRSATTMLRGQNLFQGPWTPGIIPEPAANIQTVRAQGAIAVEAAAQDTEYTSTNAFAHIISAGQIPLNGPVHMQEPLLSFLVPGTYEVVASAELNLNPSVLEAMIVSGAQPPGSLSAYGVTEDDMARYLAMIWAPTLVPTQEYTEPQPVRYEQDDGFAFYVSPFENTTTNVPRYGYSRGAISVDFDVPYNNPNNVATPVFTDIFQAFYRQVIVVSRPVKLYFRCGCYSQTRLGATVISSMASHAIEIRRTSADTDVNTFVNKPLLPYVGKYLAGYLSQTKLDNKNATLNYNVKSAVNNQEQVKDDELSTVYLKGGSVSTTTEFEQVDV